MTVVVRSTTQDPVALAAVVRATVKEIDPAIPVHNVSTMQQRLSAALAADQFNVALMLLLGFIGLVLAAVGLYGVISCFVTQRRRELAIRMALGARSADVMRMALKQGMRPVWVGVGGRRRNRRRLVQHAVVIRLRGDHDRSADVRLGCRRPGRGRAARQPAPRAGRRARRSCRSACQLVRWRTSPDALPLRLEVAAQPAARPPFAASPAGRRSRGRSAARMPGHGLAHVVFLAEPELHQQPPLRAQARHRGIEHAFDAAQAVGAAEERDGRLALHRRRQAGAVPSRT